MSGAQQFDEWFAAQQTDGPPPDFGPPPEPAPGSMNGNGSTGGFGGSHPAQAPFEPSEDPEVVRQRNRQADLDKREQTSLDYERIIRRVRRAIDAEEHASAWKRPQEFGTLADELAMPEEPITYRVQGLIPTGANVVLTAQYKTGKTTLVNHLVKCLADGTDFLGKYPVEGLDGRVGIFNYEVGQQQYRRWLRDVGVVHTDRVALLHLRGLRLPLSVRDVEHYTVDWLKRHEIQFWILDPYARALIGSAEENDNSGVGTFLDTLDVIKESAGVSELLMPAHTGRADHDPGAERARGATRIDDWPDVRWILVKEKETERRYLKCTGRDVDEPEQALAYDEHARSLAVVGGSRRMVSRVGLSDEIARFIEMNPGMGGNELHAAFPRKRADVLEALRELEAIGRIRVESGPNRRKLHFSTTASISPHNGAPPWEQPDLGAGIF